MTLWLLMKRVCIPSTKPFLCAACDEPPAGERHSDMNRMLNYVFATEDDQRAGGALLPPSGQKHAGKTSK